MSDGLLSLKLESFYSASVAYGSPNYILGGDSLLGELSDFEN